MALFVAAAASVFAGGSGLNVAVVVNADSTNSLQLGNYFCQERGVPPQNVLRIHWTGSVVVWSLTDYQTGLLDPLLAMLADRKLTNQIEYVVLSMDIPYRISGGADGVNSTTSALFYGFKPDSRSPSTCPLATNSANAYAGSEGIFRATPPDMAISNTFLATLITSSNLALAEQIVDQGVLSDGTFPTQAVVLAKTTDKARNVRYALFDNAIFDNRVFGRSSVWRTNSNNADNLGEILGYQTGLTAAGFGPTTFVPGAMADSLTSYGGLLFENSFGQTTALGYLQAGATGSYGTVVEPCNYLEKFPTPQNYFYQARGFSLAECYYQSITNPYEGVIVGEPLAAPFAVPCSGVWSNLPAGAVLVGTTNLAVQFVAADDSRPVQQVDLFVDGTYALTLTNIAPSQGNAVTVTINGNETSYTVAADATLDSVVSGLYARLNSPGYRNATRVRPYTHGDRIQLQSTDISTSGSQVSIFTSNRVGSASDLTTFVRPARSNFLDTIAWGIRGYDVQGILVTGDTMQFTATRTNGASVSVSVTNTLAGGSVASIVQQLVNAINALPELQGPDGLVAEDLTSYSTNSADFNLRARSIGWDAAQIQVSITGTFSITPTGIVRLDENLSDLQPRNHLYVTAGLTNLMCTFPLDTTTLADGWHDLTAVAYEGSHVRTQGRVSQTVQVRNSPLSATLEYLGSETNVGVGAMLPFTVVANTNDISRIELFSTGGLWGSASNQSAATFSVPTADLQVGTHPFYAMVTDASGQHYRTETRWIRIVPGFSLSITRETPTLSWPAETGRVYQVWSATNVTDAFQLRDTLSPTSSAGLWLETNVQPARQFYRVRALP